MLLVVPKAAQAEAPSPQPVTSTAVGGADFTNMAVPQAQPLSSGPAKPSAEGILSEVQLLDLRTRVLSGSADVTKEELVAAVKTLRQGRNSITAAPAAPIVGLPSLPNLPALP